MKTHALNKRQRSEPGPVGNAIGETALGAARHPGVCRDQRLPPKTSHWIAGSAENDGATGFAAAITAEPLQQIWTYSNSIASAVASPPPMHSEAMPFLPPRAWSA